MPQPFDFRKLKLASPCSEKWEGMTGDDRARFCARCRLDVFNLSGMSAAEAQALLEERTGGRLCVTFLRRRDGTILTRDCPVGRRTVRMRLAAGLALAAAMAVALVSVALVRQPRAPGYRGGIAMRVVDLKNRARTWPVVGAVINKLDPLPVRYAGGI